MDFDFLRVPLGTPLSARVAKIAHQLFLFRIHRDDWLASRQESLGLRIDVLKLRVPVDVLSSFSRLAVRLQAVAHIAQEVADNGGTNLVASLRQPLRKVTQAAAGPQ